MWEAELGLLGPQLPPSIPGAVGAAGPGGGRRRLRLTDDCDISSPSGRREDGTEMETEPVAPRSSARVTSVYPFAHVCVTSARYFIWGVSLVPRGAQCLAQGSIQCMNLPSSAFGPAFKF